MDSVYKPARDVYAAFNTQCFETGASKASVSGSCKRSYNCARPDTERFNPLHRPGMTIERLGRNRAKYFHVTLVNATVNRAATASG